MKAILSSLQPFSQPLEGFLGIWVIVKKSAFEFLPTKPCTLAPTYDSRNKHKEKIPESIKLILNQ